MIFLLSLAVLPFVLHPDPAAGWLRSKDASRRLECTHLSAEVGQRQRPGEVVISPPRGDYVERHAVLCAERLVRSDLRAPRDEAILSTLDADSAALATAAAGRRPDLAGRTWLVESYYPNPQVSAKLSFATKNALAGQGLQVSDRTPILGAADVEVLTRLAPELAYPAACERYVQAGGLRAGDALLAVISLDPRETALHAGLCVDGRWTWLQ